MKKTAFITGAGGYIGSRVAKDMAKDGICVALADINPETLKKTEQEIINAGGEAISIKVDVTDSKSVDAAIAETVEKFGRLDISVHIAGGSARIAGVTEYCDLVDTEDSVIEKVIRVNLFGAIYVARAAARQMIAQGEGGRIISFGSVVGINGLRHCTEYAVAKGGVFSLTKSLAKEVGSHGITVNCVAPGVVARPENTDVEYQYNTNFLNRKCDAQDISNLVCFIASEKAKFITGQVYVIDGGRSLAMKGTVE